MSANFIVGLVAYCLNFKLQKRKQIAQNRAEHKYRRAELLFWGI